MIKTANQCMDYDDMEGAAEALVCEMRDAAGAALEVRFAFDPAQFSPAHAMGEPPRRAVAQVQIGERRLVAEAVAMPGGYRGFHTDVPPDLPLMMMAAPDGRATLTQGALRWDGTCG